MGLIREIQEISYNQTKQLEREEKKQFEFELEKDLINCLKVNIIQAIYTYSKNDVWFKQEEIIINTIEDLKKITVDKEDINDKIKKVQKYQISEEEEYNLCNILEDIFVKETKKILQLQDLQDKTSIDKLTNELSEELEEIYTSLLNKGYNKKEITYALTRDKQLELSIEEHKINYDKEIIKKSHRKAVQIVLSNHKYDYVPKETRNTTIKSRLKNVPTSYKALAGAYIFDEFAKRWSKPHRQ